MKKLALVLAIVFAGVMTSNAQVWVGLNNIGAQIEKNHTGFSFAPEIGYGINNQWTIALGVNYAYDQADYAGITVKSNDLWLQPYVRYKVPFKHEIRISSLSSIRLRNSNIICISVK